MVCLTVGIQFYSRLQHKFQGSKQRLLFRIFAGIKLTMAEVIVQLKNVNIYRGSSLILGDVNITVNKGEFIYLVGKTGAGKSSLLKTLYGDLTLKEGEGEVAGFNLN